MYLSSLVARMLISRMRSTHFAKSLSGILSMSVVSALTLLACGDDSTEPSDDAGMGAAGATAGTGGGGRGGSSGAGQGGSGGDDPVSYRDDVRPIFQRCVICHRPGGVIGYDLVNPFDSRQGIVNRQNSWFTEHDSPFEFVVKPGDPDDSFLIYKVGTDPDDIDAANNGGPMPPVTPRVTADELSRIKQWITDGAKNDTFFAERVAPIFGTAITLGSRSGKCTLCHYPGSPTGLDVLAPFDSEVGLVNAESLLSEKPRVMPGSPENSFLVEKIESEDPSAGAPMPLNYPRLSAAEVETLRDWIAQDATED